MKSTQSTAKKGVSINAFATIIYARVGEHTLSVAHSAAPAATKVSYAVGALFRANVRDVARPDRNNPRAAHTYTHLFEIARLF